MELSLHEVKDYLNKKVWMVYIEVSPKGFKFNHNQVPIEVTVTKFKKSYNYSEVIIEVEDIDGNKLTNLLSNCKSTYKYFFTTKESAIEYYNRYITENTERIKKSIRKIEKVLDKLQTHLIQ